MRSAVIDNGLFQAFTINWDEKAHKFLIALDYSKTPWHNASVCQFPIAVFFLCHMKCEK